MRKNNHLRYRELAGRHQAVEVEAEHAHGNHGAQEQSRCKELRRKIRIFLRRDPESGGDAHGVGELVVRGHHGVEEAGSEDGEGGAGSVEELGYVRCHFGGQKDVSGDQCFESEAAPSRSAGNRNLGRFGDQTVALGEAKAMKKSVSGAQKQRKALVRKRVH